MRRKTASARSSSVRSSANVSCSLYDLAGARAGTSGRSSTPWANARTCGACPPSSSSSKSTGVAANCPTVANPAALSRCAVFGPMPGSQCGGKGSRKPRSCPGGTSMNAAGLFNFDAIWLTSLLTAMPSLTEIFNACRIASRIVAAAATAGWRAPFKSKYPSSMELTSTSGVKS